ncbi:MAG TPA: hypothetical protein ENJ99_07250 [Rhizobiales bacterium]|nr:hypothetical protein [Hyphomicrobiales bacterium]
MAPPALAAMDDAAVVAAVGDRAAAVAEVVVPVDFEASAALLPVTLFTADFSAPRSLPGLSGADSFFFSSFFSSGDETSVAFNSIVE